MTELATEIRQALTSDPRLARHIAHIQTSTRRKTLGMSIKPGEQGITIHVPAHTTPAEVIALLNRSRDRIGALLVKADRYAPDTPVRELVNGAGFLWLGSSKRLRLTAGTPAVRAVDDSGTPSTVGRWLQLDPAVRHRGAQPIVDWYIREGTAWAQPEAGQQWQRMGARQPMPVVQVADIGRTRWGVHDGRTDTVRIAWQVFQLSPRLVRHVLAHELVHATRPAGKPHGPEFWRRFEAAVPGARQEQRELTEAGRSIWMGDIA
ncbi:YgjP-like metallopeptidase domain-containing protein [Streptomyces ipomoeae]|uniref:YgjP-like metallopeptidase domain-containing protein n=1 Tax=Streptomyces ipomoeae TaxID=103232 RepID=UPI0029B9CFD2|nr:YgjP-like metallopeptidase domain-containing protein [Streptomyces ipomoeae]MDX2697235.1 DUF45 domain-containing protein [Streptomyces ipomoeae]MDX2838025.1 DUF45 domain-containing protein [Streptomyces ipomoeae]